MIKLLLTIWTLVSISYAQDDKTRLTILEETYKQQQQTLATQAETISRLEHLIAHDHKTQPTYRKILPADKILGTSMIFALMCAYTVYMETGSIVLTFGTFASYLYTFYGFLKIVRNSATVAGNSTLTAKLTRD